MLKLACNKTFKILAAFSVLTMLFLSITLNPVSASPSHCKWGGTEVIASKTGPVAMDAVKEPGVTIQCVSFQWYSIKSSATFSNVNGRYINYSNTGGYSKAKSHFNSMPGTVSSSNPNLKTTSEGTLTLYRYTGTNTNPWTLQYRASGAYYIDKIRYYDGTIPIQSTTPVEVE